ncbi:predicted redox protein, regulator of disulfide bond formation [Longilinea arvoryzae]|uniref:Predicted redox protein, regulator of disulfide bond formation n=1 Tax=Longilinea arvoryzae TaxID=360412 RepID=A0A0S7B5B4_9CHLR|nr:OsmC family protein [Longilinea arvoryzae]GAP12319.1 predicted redox protein, regulator of disulfide bond formation [Longilinea arvoryzae]
MAITTFKATSRLTSGLAVENEVRGFKITLDEPKELGGTNTGMNPVEALLCALGSCQSIVAVAFAKAKHIDLQDFWVELEGDLDPDGFLKGKPGVRNGFQEIRFNMHIVTSSSPEAVAEFQKFIQSRCPVGDSVMNGVKFVPGAIIIEQPAMQAA